MTSNAAPYIIDADARIEKMYNDFVKIAQFCQISIQSGDATKDAFPMMVDIPGFRGPCTSFNCKDEDTIAIIFVTFITSSLRNCLFPSSKLIALEMLLVFGVVIEDNYTLDRIIPWLTLLLTDLSDVVRIKALNVLTQLVCI
jgi:phosphoinositide-3-kinase regulatory subunit 4